ncbi:hypothetical protein B0H11DRAFT_1901162 [Mycena galericulata]|nr:hypothetical protein B0H11DRAFT_1901162 [Mycena galericulata]
MYFTLPSSIHSRFSVASKRSSLQRSTEFYIARPNGRIPQNTLSITRVKSNPEHPAAVRKKKAVESETSRNEQRGAARWDAQPGGFLPQVAHKYTKCIVSRYHRSSRYQRYERETRTKTGIGFGKPYADHPHQERITNSVFAEFNFAFWGISEVWVELFYVNQDVNEQHGIFRMALGRSFSGLDNANNKAHENKVENQGRAMRMNGAGGSRIANMEPGIKRRD